MTYGFDGADATALAQLVAAGEVSAGELLDAALDAVARVNPALNAVVLVQEGVARRAIADGLPHGPFRGVPFLIKDLGCEARGFPSHSGSRLHANATDARDSSIFSRIRSTGVVTFGRTTSPEGGIGPATESAVYGGPTRNPWNTRTHLGRLLGRFGGGGRGRDRAVRPWLGRRRIGAHPGILLRALRVQADAGTTARRALRGRRLGGHGDRRISHLVGPRHGGDA